MPKRGDFDTEYDDEAETRICEMEFNEDDTEEETKLKYQVLEYYNARLDERIRRKKFVIERGLLDLKKIQKQEKKRSKEERDIINAMKPFARFSDKKEHERRVNNLLKEYQLRVIIGQLKYFQSQGLTTLDQIETFIEEKKKEGKFDENKEGNTLNFIKKQKSYVSIESAGSSRAKRAPNASLEIANATGFSQLTEEEKDLVIKIGIMPEKYAQMKNLFIKEYEKNGEVAQSFTKVADKETGESTNVQQACGNIFNLHFFAISQNLQNSNLALFFIVIYNFLASKDAIKRSKPDMEIDEDEE